MANILRETSAPRPFSGTAPLDVIGSQARLPTDAGKHFGANLLATMKGEDEVRPARAFQNTMRAGGPLDAPADTFECGEDATGPG